jgi:hypothetical protein
MHCPSCAAVVPTESRFCLTCGQPLGTPSDVATIAALAVFGCKTSLGGHRVFELDDA